jgi:hypothetical protein
LVKKDIKNRSTPVEEKDVKNILLVRDEQGCNRM